MVFTEIRSKVRLMLAGFISASLGAVLYICLPYIKQAIFEKEMILTPGTKAYRYWEGVNVPVYFRIYFFNITNPMEIYENFSKPALVEMGPYTFRETRERVNISWDENGNLVYRQTKRYYFEPELTNGTLDDIVTTVNLLMTSAATRAKELDSYFTYRGFSFAFEQFDSTWFVQRPVRQLMFEGYEDPLLDTSGIFMELPFDKFGYLYNRNGSDDGEYSIFSGVNGFDNYGEVNTWKGAKTVDAYDSPCDIIKGSAGDLLQPFGKIDEKFSVFMYEFCRPMNFTYLDERVFNGLKAYRYVPESTALENGRTNPADKCYCQKGKCLPPGAIDCSRCNLFKYVSVVTSYPHFLYADSSYTDGLIGLNPDPEKHMMYIDTMKEFGNPLEFAVRFQINAIFQPVERLPKFSNFTNTTYIPIMWFSETGHVKEDLTDLLNFVLHTVPVIEAGVVIFFVTTGIFIITCTLILMFVEYFKKKSSKYGVYQNVMFHTLKSTIQKNTRVPEMMTAV